MVFDGSTCFFRGRGTDGNWSEPFEEFATGRDYTEATPWHYRFFVPHDVNGLAGLFGSREAFVRELDRLFTLESDEMQLDVSDVTGLMGQYAHGNEPSHHMAYLYNYVGSRGGHRSSRAACCTGCTPRRPRGSSATRTAARCRRGTSSPAWASYPSPRLEQFALHRPQFPKAVVRLANGRTLTVTANNPRRNTYIASVTLDGVPVTENFITYEQLMQGGELHFTLRQRPDFTRGTEAAAEPYSLTRGQVVSIPYTTQNVSLFTVPVAVAWPRRRPGPKSAIRSDGSEPDETSALYAGPVVVDRSLTLKARGFKPGAAPSRTLTLQAEKAVFRKGLSGAARPCVRASPMPVTKACSRMWTRFAGGSS